MKVKQFSNITKAFPPSPIQKKSPPHFAMFGIALASRLKSAKSSAWPLILLISTLGHPVFGQVSLDSLLANLDSDLSAQDRLSTTIAIADQLYYRDPAKTIELLQNCNEFIHMGSEQEQFMHSYHQASAHAILNHVDSANHYLETARELARQEPKFLGKLWGLQGNILSNQGKLDAGNAGYDSAQVYFELSQDTMGIMGTLNNRALNYEQQGQYQRALRDYLTAQTLAENMGNRRVIGIIHRNMGKIWHAQEDFQEAIIHFRAALQIQEELGLNRGVGAMYTFIGACHKSLDQLDSAEWYLQKGIHLSDSAQNLSDLSSGLNNLAELKRTQGKFEQAIEASQQAIDISRKIKQGRILAFALLSHGHAHRKLGNLTRAAVDFREGYDLAKEMDDVDMTQKFAESLHETLKNKSPLEALYFLEISSELKDSVLNLSNTRELTQIKMQNEFEQEQLIAAEKLKQSELETQVAEERLSRHRSTFALSLTTVGALLALAFIWISRSRLRERLAKEELNLQVEQNENLRQRQKLLAIDYMVQGQEEERKRIAKDLHDGLGSLLSAAKLQLGNIQREMKTLKELPLFEQTENLIGNAHEEVRRIAHNMMPEALMKFGLAEAIEDLAHQINVAHDVQVATNFQTDGIDLSEEREVTLYRIAQEALNNAVKHAQASTIKIDYAKNEIGPCLRIHDDGIGFDPSVYEKDGLGLKSIRSRVSYLNGEVQFISPPDGGTLIEVQLS